MHIDASLTGGHRRAVHLFQHIHRRIGRETASYGGKRHGEDHREDQHRKSGPVT